MKPADLHPLVEAGVNSKDVDALVALYEPDACFVRLDGTVAVGTDEIRVEWEAMLSLDSRVTLTTRFAVEMGDLALLSNYWCTDGDTPFASGTAEVARRQPDGRWLYVIDNPLGAPVDLPAP
jgi:ketosteroid isomerase-like protein